MSLTGETLLKRGALEIVQLGTILSAPEWGTHRFWKGSKSKEREMEGIKKKDDCALVRLPPIPLSLLYELEIMSTAWYVLHKCLTSDYLA